MRKNCYRKATSLDLSLNIVRALDYFGIYQFIQYIPDIDEHDPAEHTYLRCRQTAELVVDSWSGLRVPKEAVRMVTVTYEDKTTGQTVEENRLGVYALVGGRVEFKRIEVVTEGGGYYVVRAAGSGSSALRAGDEIIIQGTGLYDGQLLEY